MIFTREEILDRKIEWLELLIRTKQALTETFGEELTVRSLVLTNEHALRVRIRAILSEKDQLDRIMIDLRAELGRYNLKLGMQASGLPPQKS